MIQIAIYIPLSKFDWYWAMFRGRGTLRQQLRPEHDEMIGLNNPKNDNQLLLFRT